MGIDTESFGFQLRLARQRANLNQPQLAEMMGATRMAISRLELNGNITERRLRAYAAALGLEPVLSFVKCGKKRSRKKQ